MKIATRDLLSELLIQALADRVAAVALQCLAAYCCTGEQAPAVVPVGRFLLPAPAAEREQVRRLLEKNPLLSWDTNAGQVTLAPAFIPERAEIVARLGQYRRVLDEWQPEATSDLTAALRKGMLLFNHRLFFEVHEILEAQWLKETGAVKPFFQGLIQIAVAFYHLEHHNFRGALSLLRDGLEKITIYQPSFLGVVLGDFITDLETCRAELMRLGPERITQFRAEMIPRMHLLD